ncbi:MAG: NADH-quinone oxidoreductase subunit K [Deltaproteobacteria bacterium]|nr:NADH-quinone oxidoreductase subunit K [Deltaproteobacteria bacterium]
MLAGLWSFLSNKNMVRMIIGFTLFDTGTHLIMIAIGYIKGGTAPIIEDINNAVTYVDPVPQALVLTSIVIGLGITAFMLIYAVNMYKKKGSLNIDKFKDLKW